MPKFVITCCPNRVFRVVCFLHVYFDLHFERVKSLLTYFLPIDKKLLSIRNLSQILVSGKWIHSLPESCNSHRQINTGKVICWQVQFSCRIKSTPVVIWARETMENIAKFLCTNSNAVWSPATLAPLTAFTKWIVVQILNYGKLQQKCMFLFWIS